MLADVVEGKALCVIARKGVASSLRGAHAAARLAVCHKDSVRMKKLIPFVLVLAFAVWGIAQQEKKPQLPCGNGSKAFVLEASEIEDKIKELNLEGYCIGKQHFLVLGNGKVLLLLDKDDLFIEEAEDEEGEH